MDQVFWLIPVSAVVGGITYAILKMQANARVRELLVRERIALIEKGIIPPPETNPRGFERAMDAVQRLERRGAYGDRLDGLHGFRTPERHRRAGIMLMGLGLGLAFMLMMVGAPNAGLGLGGFLVLLGAAFFVNSVFERKDRLRRPPMDDLPPPPSTPPFTPAGPQAPPA